jgi:hypothetical protein
MPDADGCGWLLSLASRWTTWFYSACSGARGRRYAGPYLSLQSRRGDHEESRRNDGSGSEIHEVELADLGSPSGEMGHRAARSLLRARENAVLRMPMGINVRVNPECRPASAASCTRRERACDLPRRYWASLPPVSKTGHTGVPPSGPKQVGSSRTHWRISDSWRIPGYGSECSETGYAHRLIRSARDTGAMP